MRKHGGEYFAVSENIKRYEGDGPDPDAIVLFTFPLNGGNRRVRFGR